MLNHSEFAVNNLVEHVQTDFLLILKRIEREMILREKVETISNFSLRNISLNIPANQNALKIC